MGKLHGPGDVAGPIRGNPVWVLGCLEQADADAAGVPITGSRDDRDAHPERFAGSGGAVVGERIEGEIHAVVEAEMINDGEALAVEVEAGGIDAVLCEGGADAVGDGGIVETLRLQQEACGG